MCLKILTVVFLLTSLLLSISIAVQKCFSNKLKNTGFPAVIVFLIFLYVIEAFIGVIVLSNYASKIVMLFFGLTPFIIGKSVKYKTELFFSIVQIIFVVLSAAFLFKESGLKL